MSTTIPKTSPDIQARAIACPTCKVAKDEPCRWRPGSPSRERSHAKRKKNGLGADLRRQLAWRAFCAALEIEPSQASDVQETRFERWWRQEDHDWTRRSIAERLWEKTIVDGKCIVWTASVNIFGHGIIGFGEKNGKTVGKRRMQLVHRWLYEQVYGELTTMQVIRHSCDNARCVKLQHLEVGTQLQNIRECHERGRAAIGERQGQAKLTDEKVRQIRGYISLGWTNVQLAERYSVSRALINSIRKDKCWRHVK